MTQGRQSFLGGAACFLGSLGLFLAGAMPSLYGGDSGELIASALTLGISHAPGYPLHALMGKIFSEIIPWAGPAYRVNLSSSFLSALTAAGLFLLLDSLFARRTAALLGAAVYAVLPLVWDQAQGSEVFALNNLFAVALLGTFGVFVGMIGQRVSASKGAFLCCWAFLYGLGMANHQTLILLIPGFLFMYSRSLGSRDISWIANVKNLLRHAAPRFPAALLFFFLGLSVYVYLPLRAAKHPPVNFGDPHTARRLADAMTRREFGSLELHPSAIPFRTLQTAAEQARGFFSLNVRVLGTLVFLGGLIGFLVARDRSKTGSPSTFEIASGKPASDEIIMKPYLSKPDPPLGPRNLSWFVFWFFAGPFFYGVSNLSSFNPLAQWRMERFLLLPAIFLAVGVTAWFCYSLSQRQLWWAFLLPVGIFVEQTTALHHPWFRWNLAFRDFGRNLCSSLAPGSVLLIDRVIFDEPTSCLLVQKIVERKRPDIRVIYRPGTLFELFYGEDILEIPREQRLARQAEREAALWRGLNRPLAALAIAKDNLPPLNFQLRGLVYKGRSDTTLNPTDKVTPSPLAGEGGGEGNNSSIRRDRAAARSQDYPTRLILAHYPYFQAKSAYETKNFPQLEKWTNITARHGNDMVWLRSNLGSLWSGWDARKNEEESRTALAHAKTEFQKAAAIDPYFPQAWFGLGYICIREEKFLEAVRCFSETTRLHPSWPEAHYMLGLSYTLAGQPRQAEKPWNRFLALDPASPLAPDVRRTLSAQ